MQKYHFVHVRSTRGDGASHYMYSIADSLSAMPYFFVCNVLSAPHTCAADNAFDNDSEYKE